jgi:superfamily II DNA/RNA helicase
MPYNSRVASRRFGARNAYSSSRSGGRNRQKGGPKKDYIHPSRFVKEAAPSVETEYLSKNRFSDFDVHPLIASNIELKGFTAPSAVQDQAIPHGLVGNDVIGVANTGTGKTVAFAVPVLHRLLTNPASSVLIIAPTRELAQQIEQEFKAIGKGSGLCGALLIGGSNMSLQLRDLRAGPQIVIGTPGRIKDHLERGTLDLSGFDTVVLDEVDRMLDMGFVDDVRDILSRLAVERQSFFFSATLDRKVQDLIRTFSKDPVIVSVKTGHTSENIHQDIVCYEASVDKIEQLHALLARPEITKAIVFDETQRAVERLSKELQARGFKADDIHGGKTQGQRQRALDRFKKDQVKILVATDVAARGIDVADISHVINYSTPQNYETYIHRIGRAGRAGKIGYALTFVTERA